MQRNFWKRTKVSDTAARAGRSDVGWRGFFGRWFSNAGSGEEVAGHHGSPRIYPQIADIAVEVTLPISFVVIRFSDEYRHNFLKSTSAHDPLNEVIEVDNSSNLYYDNLSQAIAAGLEQSKNDIIAVIHEDVLLPEGWQAQFQQTLMELEEHDPSWGMLGSVGWDASGEFVGHWSDPHQFKNTFEGRHDNFQEVVKLDEQLLIFHRQRAPILDENLPGIHFLGEDLKHELARVGLKTYAINAPTIHKFANRDGEIIISSNQSDKISDRESATYLADEACCKDYVSWKYPSLFPAPAPVAMSNPIEASKRLQLQRPVIILCNGVQESALVCQVVRNCGVFIAEETRSPGEPSELMVALFKIIIEKFRCHAPWQTGYTARTLPSIAAQTLEGLPPEQPWALFFPESVLILPELSQVFPNARYLCVHRDPLDICLGATHRMARLDNHIGRIALPEAYSYLGRERALILCDDELDHMVYTTIHQIELVNQHLAAVAGSDSLVLRFEELSNNPVSTVQPLYSWLGGPVFNRSMDPIRIEESGAIRSDVYSQARIAAAADKLREKREALGYISLDDA